ncbi:hypothetical protein OAC63_05965 [Amylibacter sp.]|nr:hypothetical protein [Amylibacter sp.]
MQVFFTLAYFIIGFVQLFAIMDGIEYGIGIGGFFGFILAVVVTYIPILGSGLGVYGAINVWDWSLLQSATLFFWYVPVYLMLFIYGLVTER